MHLEVGMHQIRPSISPNGSHPSVLSETAAEVYWKLIEAQDAMGLLCPNGRDYQGGGDYQADHREHWRRMGVMQELIDQYLLESKELRKEERHGRQSV
jgi:hypothetical protein